MDYRYQRNGEWPDEPDQPGQPMQPAPPASATPPPQSPYTPYTPAAPRQQRWPSGANHPAYPDYPAPAPQAGQPSNGWQPAPGGGDPAHETSARPSGVYPPGPDTTGVQRLEHMTTSPIQYAPPPYSPDLLNGVAVGAPTPPARHSSMPGTRAASVQTQTAPRGNGPWDDDDEEDQSITTRMARLTRDPQYETSLRKLAKRRRARSFQNELLLGIDLALTIAAALLVWRLPMQYARPALSFLHLSAGELTHVFDLQHLVTLAVWMILLLSLGAYTNTWTGRFFSPLTALKAVVGSTLILSGGLYLLNISGLRSFVVAFAIVDGVLLILARFLLRPIFSRIFARRVLIIGTGRLALDTARSVIARRRNGLRLIGVAGPNRNIGPETENVSGQRKLLKTSWKNWYLGEIKDVPQLISQRSIDLVLIALPPRERYLGSWAISSVAHLPVQVDVVPDVVVETAKTTVGVVDGLPVIGLTESAVSGWNARIKRLMDLAISVTALLLLWPLMLLIALLIRLTSPGPALFKQERIGQHNHRFQIYKFRTMYVDAEQRRREVMAKTQDGMVHKRRRDPRVTPFGAILRRTSLDELPQLINILKGDMSVVGPRPELPWIVERYRAWQYRRLLVPQGLTGWWQVHGRSDRVLHLHTQDDIYYVRAYSLWLDIKIIFMTIWAVIGGRGAF